MFKRLFWLTVGVASGFGGSVWLQRRVRQAIDRFAPASVQSDMRAAVAEGRTAMRSREAELRARYDSRLR
ncbi:MAG: hypothetical protein M3527_05245 [Actinomycetota bacterium]|nr:hypothetical protein [Acidimicrobiia bacterium]MDQ3293839.1 hypothetical protein [Actinomycetota bacterium]